MKRLYVTGALGSRAIIPEDAEVVLAFPSVLAVLDTAKPKEELSLPIERALEVIASVAKERVAAVVLSGDPLFFGMGERIKKAFPEAVFIPSPSYMQAAFCKIGISWQNADFLSLHAREMDSLLYRLSDSGRFLFLYTDEKNSPSAVARYLLGKEVSCVDRFWVFERLGLSDERWGSYALEEAAEKEFLHPNCVIIEKKHGYPSVWSDVEYEVRRGLLTKSVVRGILWSMFPGGDVLWDLGAGSGAVGITMSLKYKQVFAVERDGECFELLKRNREKFGRWNVIPVMEDAFDVLQHLPEPDGIFIGTGGSSFSELFELCASKIRRGGIVVATFVSGKGLAEALKVVERWSADLWQWGVCRGEMGLWGAKNPLWMLVWQRST